MDAPVSQSALPAELAAIPAVRPQPPTVLLFEGVTKRFATRTATPFTAVQDLTFGVRKG